MSRAALVVSECQAGKTAKVLEVIKSFLAETTLVLVVTQANSKLSVEQFAQRAVGAEVVPHVLETYDNLLPPTPPTHTLIVGFHHKKHENSQIAFLKSTKHLWSNVVLVIDEADEGGLNGVENRLEFVSRVEEACRGLPLNLILITATIANLSKQILKLTEEGDTPTNSGLISMILYQPCVKVVYATPPSTYVGYKWFVDTPDVWVPLELPKRKKGIPYDEYIRLVDQCVIDKFAGIDDSYKELSLISISHKIDDHGRLGSKLLKAGFNISIPYNAKHHDCIEVYYRSTVSNKIKLWLLPSTKLNMLANTEKMTYAGIKSSRDYTHSHVLQAAVFMRSAEAETRIKQNCVEAEVRKLQALANSISQPTDFPIVPRVALIAGKKAGRGITFQNPGIDFVCTSFCFIHVKDKIQRGAINTQKLGRAFGALEGCVSRPGRKPLLIATKELLVDAGANRDVLSVPITSPDKLYALKDMITTEMYDSFRIKNKVNIDAKEPKKTEAVEGVIDGVDLKKLQNWLNDDKLLIGSMVRYLYEHQGTPLSFDKFKEGINYIGTDEGFESNIKNGVGVRSSYGKLWTYRQNKIYLNPNLRDHIAI